MLTVVHSALLLGPRTRMTALRPCVPGGACQTDYDDVDTYNAAQAQLHRSIWPHALLAKFDKDLASKFGDSIAYSVKAGTQNRNVQKRAQEIAASKGIAVDKRGTLADRTRVHALVRSCPHKGKVEVYRETGSS